MTDITLLTEALQTIRTAAHNASDSASGHKELVALIGEVAAAATENDDERLRKGIEQLAVRAGAIGPPRK
jgi:DNA invertase Pin-like site-specific DNA recombinase